MAAGQQVPVNHIYQVALSPQLMREQAVLSPQLTSLTATLRKKKCAGGHPGPCHHRVTPDSSQRSDSNTPTLSHTPTDSHTETELIPHSSEVRSTPLFCPILTDVSRLCSERCPRTATSTGRSTRSGRGSWWSAAATPTPTPTSTTCPTSARMTGRSRVTAADNPAADSGEPNQTNPHYSDLTTKTQPNQILQCFPVAATTGR